MKTIVRIFAVLFAFAAFALIGLLMGCTSIPKVGDGKLEPVTKTAVKLGASAAGIAAPEYAGAIGAVADKLVTMGEEPKPATSKEQVAAIMKAAGYAQVYTVYFDGIVINDFSRFSYRDAWEKAGTGATVDPAEMIETATGAEAEQPESDIDAGIDAAIDALSAKKKAK